MKIVIHRDFVCQKKKKIIIFTADGMNVDSSNATEVKDLYNFNNGKLRIYQIISCDFCFVVCLPIFSDFKIHNTTGGYCHYHGLFYVSYGVTPWTGLTKFIKSFKQRKIIVDSKNIYSAVIDVQKAQTIFYELFEKK